MLFCPSAFNSQSHYFVSDNVPMKSAPRLIHVHCLILWYPVAFLLHKRFISRRSNELYWWMQQDLLPYIWCKGNQSMEDFFLKKRSFCLFNYQHSLYLFKKLTLELSPMWAVSNVQRTYGVISWVNATECRWQITWWRLLYLRMFFPWKANMPDERNEARILLT